MKKVELVNNTVVNIIEIDPNNIPYWCSNWPEPTEEVSIGWTYKNSQFISPSTKVPTQKEQETNRQLAFVSEADPLFFQWQAGEATEEEWKVKRQEIRDRYPYPVI